MNHTHESKLNGGRIPYAPKSITSRQQNKYADGDTRPTDNNLKRTLLAKDGRRYHMVGKSQLVRA